MYNNHPRDLIKDSELEHKELPHDMYGVGIVITIRDFADISAGRATCSHISRFLFGSSCVVLNIGLQVALCLWLKANVITPSVLELQQNYAWFSADMYTAGGEFKPHIWKTWNGPARALCDSAMSRSDFTLVILFLWTSRMFGEILECARLEQIIRGIRQLPPGASIAEMVHENGEGEDEKHDIVALNSSSRVALYFLVVLPKTVVSVLLLVFGCVWMSATKSFADLILNALALEFIIAIDRLIFESFFPPSMKDDVEKGRFVVPRQGSNFVTSDVSGHHRTILYLCMVCAFVGCFFFRFQLAIPGFRHDIASHCAGLTEEPRCEFGQADCFPYGKGPAERNSVYKDFLQGKLDNDYDDDHEASQHRATPAVEKTPGPKTMSEFEVGRVAKVPPANKPQTTEFEVPQPGPVVSGPGMPRDSVARPAAPVQSQQAEVDQRFSGELQKAYAVQPSRAIGRAPVMQGYAGRSVPVGAYNSAPRPDNAAYTPQVVSSAGTAYTPQVVSSAGKGPYKPQVVPAVRYS